jgi:hypothetical protein
MPNHCTNVDSGVAMRRSKGLQTECGCMESVQSSRGQFRCKVVNRDTRQDKQVKTVSG